MAAWVKLLVAIARKCFVDVAGRRGPQSVGPKFHCRKAQTQLILENGRWNFETG